MKHPYAEFLHLVDKPARYLGGEYQSVVKDPASVRVRYALCFPDVYDIGMSHLGTKILYGILNKTKDIAAERCFCPWTDCERELRTRGLPLVSLETATPLSAFHVIGFSLQYEMTYTNVLNMLELGRVPLHSAERGDTDPLVIAGGPSATHPEPLAPFIDAFVIGDGEERLPALLRTWAEAREAGLTRREALVRIAQGGAVYVPAFYATAIDPLSDLEVVTHAIDPRAPLPVERSYVHDIDAYPFPDDAPVPAAEAIFDRMAIEIARGCTEGCRFCQAGMIYRPVRERSPRSIVSSVLGAIEKAGYDEVSLTSLSTADYSCITPLVKEVAGRLRPRNVSLSVSSLRAYGLDEGILDEIASVRATGLTFAPEAGTQRMRDVITKNISEDQLHATAHRVFSRGWSRIKTYFMIGLPTETNDDVEGIVQTARAMRDIGRIYVGRDASVTVSVSSHVPKPHTPFQWAAMDTIAEIERKQAILDEGCRCHRLKFRRHDPRSSLLEGVVGRGDRRVAALIERAFRKGCRYDGWDDRLQFESWVEAMDELRVEQGFDPNRYLRALRLDARLPWDHVDVGLVDGFLQREWKRALAGKLSPPCGKPNGAVIHHTNAGDAEADTRKLVCYNCGLACDLTQMRDERIAFLKDLGATRRTVETGPAQRQALTTSVGLDELTQKAGRNAAGKKVPFMRPDTGPGFRYRVRFEKRGAEALTSHLDLVRSLPRIFRRAGVEPKYTRGYHPKPIMTYSPALGLGIESACELLDIMLKHDPGEAQLHERLGAACPPGLRVVSVARLDETARPLMHALAVAVYRVRPRLRGDAPAPPDEAGRTALRRRVERALWAFEATGSWLDRVERKDGPRTLDLRANLRSIGLESDGHVRLALEVSDSVSARPEEIVAAALRETERFDRPLPSDIERVALLGLDADGAPVDLVREAGRAVSRLRSARNDIGGGAAEAAAGA